MSDGRLSSGRVVVITGATAGVGRAAARAFADRGYAVALLARGEDGLAAAAAEVRAKGARALAISVDVSSAGAVESAADRIEAELGPIDVWVNNAMTSVFSPFLDMEPVEFDRVTAVTYTGFVHGTRAALRRMIPRDSGRVVNVGSSLAYRGIPLQSAYCGAKHAIQGFTDSVRTELLHRGSKVSLGMVQLPAMNTPQFRIVRSKMPRKPMPVPPIYQPEIGAKAVVWMAEHKRGELWVAPITAFTILGDKLAPRLLDRYLGRTGFDAQLTEEPEEPRLDNLFAPVPGDAGAHGPFDDSAKTSDPSALVLRNLPVFATAAAGAATVLLGSRVWAALRR